MNILISGSESPKFHLYREALELFGANVTDGYLPEYDDRFDGLLIAGGCDVSPELYGESDNGSVSCDIARDKCEIGLIREFAGRGKPIFGICRGMQILNVCFGGTLIGDLPEYPKHHGKNIYHGIKITDKSGMFGSFGDEMRINSFHHQAVKELAKDFKAVAYGKEDGVIEAMEHIEKPWMAVQFHPERMLEGDGLTDDARPIFEYFISLCKNR